MRSIFIGLGVPSIALGWLVAVGVAGEYPHPGPPEMRDDATLNDVTFVDPERGWAVGDRGVILHTRDGGRHWQLQASPALCRLESVYFLDAQNGWVVGGWTQPFTHKSAGVVLRTYDGGGRWEQIKDASLPLLHKVKFFDARNGWAVGLPSSLYRSGIFTTHDGGRSWSPIPGNAPGAYLTADFTSPEVGAAAGYRGTLTLVRRNGVQISRTPYLGPRALNDLQLFGPTGGWLVGDGGLCLTTRDGGLTWQSPPAPIPPEVGNHFDFHAVATKGNQVWLAGSPGSRVIHSMNGGQTWQPRATPVTAPLKAITFVDEHRGWAVGALGTILATSDGGGSWQVQRAGGRRSAVLVIASRVEEIPWEVLVKHAGNDGMLTAIEVVGRDEFDARRPAETPDRERLVDAATAAGGTAAAQLWRYPLRQRELGHDRRQLSQLWDQVNDGQAAERLEETLVRAVRIWRPTVLIVPSPQSGGDPAGSLVSQAALAAADKAADSTQYVEQLTTGGLQPWRISKACAVIDDARLSHFQIHTSSLAPRLGCSLSEGSQIPRGLVSAEAATSPAAISLLQLSRSTAAGGGKGQDLFAQVPMPSIGEARRRLSQPSAGALDQMTRWAQRQSRVERLLADAQAEPRQFEAMLGQLKDLTQGLSRSGGGDILYHLAGRLWDEGKLESAAEVYSLLVEQHGGHSTRDAALLWLCQYYSSGEIAMQATNHTRYLLQDAEFTVAPRDPKRPVAVAAHARPVGIEGTASASPLAVRARQAAALAENVRRTQPALHADPRFRFPLGAAQRLTGAGRSVDAYFHQTASREGDPWQVCAAAEIWLTQPVPQAPKAYVHCRGTAEKPYLDGVLDDACWQHAAAMPIHDVMLNPADGQTPAAEARICYDREFLYLAVSCPRLSPRPEMPPAGDRERDGDLAQHDRVQWLIDLDRDYSTWFRFEIDHRGAIADDCWGDRSWTPQWFAAHGGDRSRWVAEAAIAWKSLAKEPPRPKSAWAMNVQRIAPGHSFSAWSRPAAAKPRGEGFGLVLFEE